MPRTRGVLIAIGVALAAALLFWAGASSREEPATDGLYASSFVDASGTPQPLGQWRGKVLVVNFWASWCPPCLEEMPALNQLHRQYAAKGMQLVGISAEDMDTLKKFGEQVRVEYPLLAADAQAMSLAASLGNDRSILPFTVVVDKHGKIAHIMFGKVENSALEKAVTPLL